MHQSFNLRPLIAFTKAFHAPSYSASVLEFLIPALAPAITRPPHQHRHTRKQRYATKHHSLFSRNVSQPGKDVLDKRGTTRNYSERPAPSTKDEWLELLDPYLPVELRSKSWIENLAAFQGVRPICSLPALLRDASSAFSTSSLLAYLAVNKGRLDAFLWLTQALLNCDGEASVDSEAQEVSSPWQTREAYTLDDLTAHPISSGSPLEIPRLGELPESAPQENDGHEFLEPLKDHGIKDSTSMSATDSKDALGHVWQCLGRMVLEAAGKGQEPKMKLMSHVYQVVAWMHTKNVVSPSIYQYDSDNIPATTRKSPLLHLTSSRIMATASESMWKVNERNIIGDAAIVAAGHAVRDQQSSGADFVPHLHPLGPEIWLEFILWSCIHGDHLAQAAKLVLHASRVKTKAGFKVWQAIGWKELQKVVSEMSDSQHAKSWFTRIASAIEGYSEEPPLIELPANTISTEVVAVVLDGLVGAASSIEQDIPSDLKLWPCVEACKAMLGRRGDGFDFLFWNSILARFFEMNGGFADPKLSAMTQVIQLAQQAHKARQVLEEAESSDSLASEFALQQHSPVNSFMVRTLDECVRKQDVEAALGIFRKLRHLIDTSLQNTNEEQPYGDLEFDLDIEPRETKAPTRAFSNLIKFIPLRTLATFIDLLTAAKRYDVCKSILSSDNDDDVYIVPTRASESPVLQPALLRYATAAPDFGVLTAVTRKLTSPQGEQTLKTLQALFHGQVVVGKWNNCRDLLEYLSTQGRDLIGPRETMVVASTILLAEADMTEADPPLSKGRDILDLILKGTYLPPPDPQRPPDYMPYRQLNQTWRILASAPGRLATLLPSWIAEKTQMHAPTSIDVGAFNTFLDALVDIYGAPAGKGMFDRWCIKPDKIRETIDEDGKVTIYRESFDEERVVVPDLRTIQIILSPALVDLAKYLKSNESVLEEEGCWGQSEKTQDLLLSWDSWGLEERERPSILKLPSGVPHRKLLQWGEAMYRIFDLGDVEIYEAMPGACSRPAGYERTEPPTKIFSVGQRASVAGTYHRTQGRQISMVHVD